MKKVGIVFIIVMWVFSHVVSGAADDYPNKPVQLICPYGAGGLTDICARVVADKMTKYLGKPVIVVNKAGGGSTLGTAYVVASKPDGYTVLINTEAVVVGPLITPDLPYKMSDLKPVGKVITAVNMLLVNKDLPVKTLPELIAFTKKNPGKLSYGSPGVGTVNSLTLELIIAQTKMDMQNIPYASELPAITALVGNFVQAGVAIVPTGLPYIQANQLKALAVLSEKRHPLLPGVATSGEQGFPEAISSLDNMLFVPAPTPAPIVKKLEEALQKALRDKDVVEKLEKMLLTIDFLRSSDTQIFLDNEFKKWAPIVKRANIVVK